MHSIAVCKTCCIENGTVLIENSRADNYFLPAVLIHVSSHAVVVAVAVADNGLVRAGIPLPVELELLVLDLVGGHGSALIVASSEAGVGVNAVEVGNAACETVAAVAPCIAP